MPLNNRAIVTLVVSRRVVVCRCAVTGGKPKATLSWHQIDKSGRSSKLGEEFVRNITYEGNVTSLELAKKLSRDDLNARYECRVEHGAISDADAEKYSARTSLDLNGKNTACLFLEARTVLIINLALTCVNYSLLVGATALEMYGPQDEVQEGDVVQFQVSLSCHVQSACDDTRTAFFFDGN